MKRVLKILAWVVLAVAVVVVALPVLYGVVRYVTDSDFRYFIQHGN